MILNGEPQDKVTTILNYFLFACGFLIRKVAVEKTGLNPVFNFYVFFSRFNAVN